MSSGTNAGSNGWTHDFVGYVFPLNEGSQGGMVPIAVGHETTYWSNLVQRGEYIQVRDLLESYYSPSPGAVSIHRRGRFMVLQGNIGNIGSEYRR